jgi:hypothetical protein
VHIEVCMQKVQIPQEVQINWSGDASNNHFILPLVAEIDILLIKQPTNYILLHCINF